MGLEWKDLNMFTAVNDAASKGWDSITGDDTNDEFAPVQEKVSKADRDREAAKAKGIDSLTMGDIEAFMAQGRARGEELTGVSSAEAGKKRGEIRGKYEDIVNGPSRGAARTADARNADQKRLRQNQGKSGVSGGMAQLQQNQMSQDYAGKIGDVRQKEYLSALDKIEKQYRGATSDIMTAEGGYGAIGVGGKPAPQVQGEGGGLFDSYLCTELFSRKLVSRAELTVIHILLIVGTLFKPAQTLFYLKNGAKLLENLKAKYTDNGWDILKLVLFDVSISYIREFKLFSAFNHYEYVTRKLFTENGFEQEVKDFDHRWSFRKAIESFKFMWRIA